jgi:hypothetical protein
MQATAGKKATIGTPTPFRDISKIRDACKSSPATACGDTGIIGTVAAGTQNYNSDNNWDDSSRENRNITDVNS